MAIVAATPRTNTFTVAVASDGPFDIGFRLFDTSTLDVYVDGEITDDWTLSTNFVDGFDDDATLTFGTEQPAGTRVQIDGALTPARGADYVKSDPGLTRKLNIELARVWSSVSELHMKLGRAMRSTTPLPAFEGLSAETIANAMIAAGDIEQSLAEILAFTETQMRSVSEFSSLDAFESYRSAFDYWRVGSLVNVGDMTLQKRASDGGTIWVRVDQEADKLINSYLEDVAGSVEPRHLASIPAMSLLGNALVRQGRPRGVPYEEFLYNIGHRWYGDTANGGFNVPRSEVTPNAANATRSGRGTSTAGATTVTFHTPFAPCIPNVIITPKATNLADTPLTATLIGDPIPESFSFVIKDSTGTAVVRDFTYIATGNGDY